MPGDSKRCATTGAAPVVSVIVPFLNPGLEFFSEAVESVFAQTFTEWELLLVDDGATSPVTEFAIACARRNPEQVRFAEHPGHENRGISASRNLGIQLARGQFVSFLDADDVMEPDKLAIQLEALTARPDVAMVCGNTLYWHSWNPHRPPQARDFVPTWVPENQIFTPPDPVPLVLEGRSASPCICSLVVRRDVALQLPFEPEFRGMYEDQVFLSKVFLNHKVLFAPHCLEKYRQHPGSMCAVDSQAAARTAARVKYLAWLRRYLKSLDISSAGLTRSLKRQVWLWGESGRGGGLAEVARRIRKWLLKGADRLLPTRLRRRRDPVLRARSRS